MNYLQFSTSSIQLAIPVHAALSTWPSFINLDLLQAWQGTDSEKMLSDCWMNKWTQSVADALVTGGLVTDHFHVTIFFRTKMHMNAIEITCPF